MTRLPAQFHREPDQNGKPGRLFAHKRTTLTVLASQVFRSAPFEIGSTADHWANRTIRAEFEIPDRALYGVIDSYGYAQDLSELSGVVWMYRTPDDDFAGRPYLLGSQLTFDVQLGPTSFMWLWGEMQGRSGQLEMSLTFPVLFPQDAKAQKGLKALAFVDADPRGEERDEGIGFAMRVIDRWS